MRRRIVYVYSYLFCIVFIIPLKNYIEFRRIYYKFILFTNYINPNRDYIHGCSLKLFIFTITSKTTSCSYKLR